MEATRVISTTTMKAPSHNNNTKTTHKIHLNPWDLNFLTLETIQKGLLFHNPHNIEEQQDISIQIQHLKNTLSSTLSFFPLLSGRLDIILNEHEDNKNATSYILCNNSDGKSFWHFINSWAEISRGNHKISKLPSFQRFFFDTIDQPIRFTFTKHDESYSKNSSPLPERVFHFSKEEILKLKANEEANTDKISSLQALLSHVWKSVTRCKHVDP
ncbi:hypothetical protein Lal_00016720 [Lupinus albus]|nr:hypothetical protein Lal_00016720 [Lupinus albus]